MKILSYYREPPIGDEEKATDHPIRVEEKATATVLIWEEPDSFPPLIDDPTEVVIKIETISDAAGITLSDIEDYSVFDCPICHDALKPTIYQCALGHAVCSNCKPKMHKCDLCVQLMKDSVRRGFTTMKEFQKELRSKIWEFRRCYLMENVLNSMRFYCRNEVSGCEAELNYYDFKVHDKMCSHALCYCPYMSCSLFLPRPLFFDHMRDEHHGELVEIVYGTRVKVTIPQVCTSVVLVGNDGSLFLLQKLGGGNPGTSSLSVLRSLVSHLEDEPYQYDLKTEALLGSRVGSYVHLRSKVEAATPDRSVEGSKISLEVPAACFLPNGDLPVDVCIGQD